MRLSNLHQSSWMVFMLLLLAYELPFASSKRRHTHRLNHSSNYTRTRPYVGNVTCNDSNFHRTLTWIPHNVTDNLRLLNYSVQFCPTSECNYGQYDAICFSEDGKTKLDSLNSTYCKMSLEQLTIFAYNTFRVRGIFRDIFSNKTVRSKAGAMICLPIEDATTLGPPHLGATATKNHITIDLSLPEELQKAFNDMSNSSQGMDLVVSYHFCVYEHDDKGASCTECSPHTRKDLNPTMTYVLLEPNTQYTVRGWYMILGEHLVKSTEAKREMSTFPDPFPLWLQIAICIVAVLMILLILVVITGKHVCNKLKDAKMEIHKAIPKFLQEAIEEARRYEGTLDYNPGIMVHSDWTILQALSNNAYDIPLIQRVVKPTSQRNKELPPPTGATDVRMDLVKLPSAIVGEDETDEGVSQESSQCSRDDDNDCVQLPRGVCQDYASHETNTAVFEEGSSQAVEMHGCQTRVNKSEEGCDEYEPFIDSSNDYMRVKHESYSFINGGYYGKDLKNSSNAVVI